MSHEPGSAHPSAIRFPAHAAFLGLVTVLLFTALSRAAEGAEPPGHPIGRITTYDELIVLQLDNDALGRPNLFDLAGRTLRFTPAASRYRVESRPLKWDPDFGPELEGSEVTLHGFAFPFSGKKWTSFRVGTTGSIRFGGPVTDALDPYFHRDGGVILGRFDALAAAAGTIMDNAPALCVFLKPRLAGKRYVKELKDRVVVTWDLTEPFGGFLDFGWYRTVNRFQAVLHEDGAVEMAYAQVAAKDAVVGLFPALPHDTKRSATRAAVDLSSLTRRDGPFDVVYETFHYPAPPRPRDLACTVLGALGDRFDFLAYYADFRVDVQEASPTSDGPMAGGVKGIGVTAEEPKNFCTQGRLELGYSQPVWVGANEMQERPPAEAPVGGEHDVTFYARQLAGRMPEGKAPPYDYAVGHLGHEFAHRWGAYVSAKVNGETIPLGTTHWVQGLNTPVAFPYERPTEASTLGGGVWQDNFDGTWTRLHDGFFLPATGYSHLDLYLMGLIAAKEVPDFFILRNLVRAGTDAMGRPIFTAKRTKVTIEDVVAAEGKRAPDVDHAQRRFNTGIVVLVEHGRSPSRELVERAEGISRQWIEFWGSTTGHRATMTTDPD